MASVQEFNSKVEISIGAIIFIIVSVFTLTTIYNRFETVNKELDQMREEFEQYKEDTDQWLLELDQRLLNVERCK